MWHSVGGSVLATLVGAKGSSYRRPGARLLLQDQHQYAGTISGGCLEAEVVRKAAWLIREGAVVERYSTEFDNTAEIPFGLGCGGVVDLLLEPTASPEFLALISALERAIAGKESIVVNWLPRGGRALARTILTPGGDVLFASRHLAEAALTAARTAVLHGVELDLNDIFVEHLYPPQRVFILGAGDDAKPLVSLGAVLGWSMNVLDGRSQLARPVRFPGPSVWKRSIDPELTCKASSKATL